MSDKNIQDIFNEAEDTILKQIIDAQEGKLGLEELKQSGEPPPPDVLEKWNKGLDALECQQRKTARKHHWLRRVVVVAAVLALLLLPSAAVRNALHNLYISVMERYTQVQLNEPVEQIVSRWKNAYLPSYLPGGFSLTDANNSGDAIFLEYSNSDEERITFYQYNDQSNSRLDTQDAEDLQTCEIGELTGHRYRKAELCTLYWSNGELNFSIEFKSSIVTWDEIIKMAESMEQ